MLLQPNYTHFLEAMIQNVIHKVYKQVAPSNYFSGWRLTGRLKELNLNDVAFSLAHSRNSFSLDLILSWKKLRPTMNASLQETEVCDAEDDLRYFQLVKFFRKRTRDKRIRLNSWFKRTVKQSKWRQMEPPTTIAKIKTYTAFNCICTCITWA